MKKMIATFVLGSLLIGQTAYANEVTVAYEQKINASDSEPIIKEEVTVDSELIGFVGAFQEVAVELSGSKNDRLSLLVQFITQQNKRLEVLLVEERFEEAIAVLEKYNADIDEIQEILESDRVKLEVEEVEVLEGIEETLAEKTSMRGVNLQNLLNQGELPAPALAGINKALENQRRSEEKRQLAQDRKEQRKVLKLEKATDKQEENRVDEVEAEEEEVTASSVQKQIGKVEKADKAQMKAGKQADKGKEKAAKAQERGKEKAKDRSDRAKKKSNQQDKGNGKGK